MFEPAVHTKGILNGSTKPATARWPFTRLPRGNSHDPAGRRAGRVGNALNTKYYRVRVQLDRHGTSPAGQHLQVQIESRVAANYRRIFSYGDK